MIQKLLKNTRFLIIITIGALELKHGYLRYIADLKEAVTRVLCLHKHLSVTTRSQLTHHYRPISLHLSHKQIFHYFSKLPANLRLHTRSLLDIFDESKCKSYLLYTLMTLCITLNLSHFFPQHRMSHLYLDNNL